MQQVFEIWMNEFGFCDGRCSLAGFPTIHGTRSPQRTQGLVVFLCVPLCPLWLVLRFRKDYEAAGCGMTRVPDRRNSKCKTQVRGALVANFHLRAASIDFLAK